LPVVSKNLQHHHLVVKLTRKIEEMIIGFSNCLIKSNRRSSFLKTVAFAFLTGFPVSPDDLPYLVRGDKNRQYPPIPAKSRHF
jgi:hypothetical protein